MTNISEIYDVIRNLRAKPPRVLLGPQSSSFLQVQPFLKI